MSSLLQLIQDITDETGMPRPSSVIGSNDQTIRTLLATAQSVAEGMLRYPWQQRKKRGTFTSVATESQGSLSTVFGSEFKALLPGTFWNDDLRLPIFGPVGDPSWQILKNFLTGGPTYQYKIFDNTVRILPVLPAGNTLSFMYMSKYTIEDSGGTGKSRWTANTDVPRFPDEVFKSQFKWRWMRARNEPWAALYEEAQGVLAAAVNDDGAMPILHLDSPTQTLTPGVWVPAGSWNV